ncbi:MAG: LPD1 domain-containing protein [Bryobacteraceae bacterium]
MDNFAERDAFLRKYGIEPEPEGGGAAVAQSAAAVNPFASMGINEYEKYERQAAEWNRRNPATPTTANDLIRATKGDWSPAQYLRRMAEADKPLTAEQKAEQFAQGWNEAHPERRITAKDLPDRPGVLGGAEDLIVSTGQALLNRLPEDLARVARGGNIELPKKPKGVGAAVEYAKESAFSPEATIQRSRRDEFLPSRQAVSGDTLRKGLWEGPQSIPTSVATTIGGGVIGGKTGAALGGAIGGAVTAEAGGAGAVPGAAIGGVAGSMVGAATLSGVAFYRLAKDQFLEEVLNQAQKNNVNLSQKEWNDIRAKVEDDAQEFGYWEAVPEAVGSAITTGIFSKAGTRLMSKIPVLGKIFKEGGEGALSRALAKVPGAQPAAQFTGKLAADMAEETATEAATFMGQEGIRKEQGLRDTEPTLGEFGREQLPAVLVGTAMQGGAMQGVESYRERGERIDSRKKWVDEYLNRRGAEVADEDREALKGAVLGAQSNEERRWALDSFERNQAVKSLAGEGLDPERAQAIMQVQDPVERSWRMAEALNRTYADQEFETSGQKLDRTDSQGRRVLAWKNNDGGWMIQRGNEAPWAATPAQSGRLEAETGEEPSPEATAPGVYFERQREGKDTLRAWRVGGAWWYSLGDDGRTPMPATPRAAKVFEKWAQESSDKERDAAALARAEAEFDEWAAQEHAEQVFDDWAEEQKQSEAEGAKGESPAPALETNVEGAAEGANAERERETAEVHGDELEPAGAAVAGGTREGAGADVSGAGVPGGGRAQGEATPAAGEAKTGPGRRLSKRAARPVVIQAGEGGENNHLAGAGVATPTKAAPAHGPESGAKKKLWQKTRAEVGSEADLARHEKQVQLAAEEGLAPRNVIEEYKGQAWADEALKRYDEEHAKRAAEEQRRRNKIAARARTAENTKGFDNMHGARPVTRIITAGGLSLELQSELRQAGALDKIEDAIGARNAAQLMPKNGGPVGVDEVAQWLYEAGILSEPGPDKYIPLPSKQSVIDWLNENLLSKVYTGERGEALKSDHEQARDDAYAEQMAEQAAAEAQAKLDEAARTKEPLRPDEYIELRNDATGEYFYRPKQSVQVLDLPDGSVVEIGGEQFTLRSNPDTDKIELQDHVILEANPEQTLEVDRVVKRAEPAEDDFEFGTPEETEEEKPAEQPSAAKEPPSPKAEPAQAEKPKRKLARKAKNVEREPVKIGAPATAAAAKPVEKPKRKLGRRTSNDEMIQDAGEKIGGARKDRWAARGLDVSDLEGMTAGEEYEHVTKDNVWPAPDYAHMIEAGMNPDVVWMLKTIRDRVGVRPLRDTADGRRQYIAMLKMARALLGSCRTVEEIEAVANEAFKLAKQNDPENHNDLYFSITKPNQRYSPLRITYKDKRKAQEEIDRGWPKPVPAYLKGKKIRLDQQRGNYVITQGYHVLPGRFASEAEAEAHLKAEWEKKRAEGPVMPDRPHLDNLQRSGKDIRNGRDVDSQDFIDQFGFRGVEFGNWVASDERQKAVNFAFEALHDLADVLGVEPRALSLDGTMALAFGARGGGWASAHYEPGKLVINLTKLRGAGALAHEFAHALDHYFGQMGRDLGTAGKATMESDTRTPEKAARVGTNPGNLRAELQEAYDGVMRAIFKRNKTRAEAIMDQEQAIEKLIQDLERVKGYIDKAREKPDAISRANLASWEKWVGLAEPRLERMQENLNTLRGDETYTPSTEVNTDYAREAVTLGKYWERPHEMFARALESYVFDKIAAADGRNDYLVHGVEGERYSDKNKYKGNPYPAGLEREAINAAFDKLFATIETKTSERGNPILYSVGDKFWDADVAKDPVEPDLIDIQRNRTKILAECAEIFNGWPETIVGADGKRIKMRHPENGSVRLRLEHLLSRKPDQKTGNWKEDPKLRRQPRPDELTSTGRLWSKDRMRWFGMVEETLKNAGAVLFDDREESFGSHIYIRIYQDGSVHGVIVRPDGTIDEQGRTGNLISQYPVQKGASAYNMEVIWQRGEAPGLSGQAGSTTRASMIPDSQRAKPRKLSRRTARGVKVEEARAQVAELQKNWTNGPKNFHVVQSESDVPAGVRRRGMRGAYDPNTDTVWIVADNLDAEHDAAFVALHEVVGHRGLRAVLGDGLDAWLDRLIEERRAEVEAYAEEHGIDDMRLAAEEWLSDRIGAGEFDRVGAGLIGRLWEMMQKALEKLLGRKATDRQISELVVAARAKLEGKGSGTYRGATVLNRQSAISRPSESAERNRLAPDGTNRPGTIYSSQNHIEMARRFAEKFSGDIHYAQTGSVYVTVHGVKFRFANHADAYANSIYSVDPFDGTYQGAVDLANKIAAGGDEANQIISEHRKHVSAMLNEQRAAIRDDLDQQIEQNGGLEKIESSIERLEQRLSLPLSDPAAPRGDSRRGIVGSLKRLRELRKRAKERVNKKKAPAGGEILYSMSEREEFRLRNRVEDLEAFMDRAEAAKAQAIGTAVALERARAKEKATKAERRGRRLERRAAETALKKVIEGETAGAASKEGIPAGRAVRQAAGAGEKKGRRLGKSAAVKEAAESLEKLTGQEPVAGKEPETIYQALRAAFDAGRAEGIKSGTARAVGDVIDASLRKIAERYQGDLVKWAGALHQVNDALEEAEDAIQAAGGDEASGRRIAKAMLIEAFGPVRYAEIERSAENPMAVLARLRRALDKHLARYYGKAAAKLITSVNPDKLYNEPRVGLPYGDEWNKLLEGYKSLVELRKKLHNKKGYLSKFKAEMSPEAVRNAENEIAALKDEMESMVESLPWKTSRELFERLAEIKAASDLLQDHIAGTRKVKRAEAGIEATKEVEAALELLSEIEEGRTPPERGIFRKWLVDGRGDEQSWALTLCGGDEGSVIYQVLYENLRKGSRDAMTAVGEVLRKLKAALAAEGITDAELRAWSSEKKKYMIDGHAQMLTDAEIMNLYALWWDNEARMKVKLNGFKSFDKRKLNVHGRDIIGGISPERTAQIVEDLISGTGPFAGMGLSEKQKRMVAIMRVLKEALTEAGNETSHKIFGYQKFRNQTHWRILTDRSDRPAGNINALEDIKGFDPKQLTQMGMVKERVPHGHPIMLENIFDAFLDQVQQMADFTHQSIPSLDALALLNHGAVKPTEEEARLGVKQQTGFQNAMTERVGAKFASRMKHTIARLTHMETHSEGWGWLQKWLAKMERRAATAILGFRLTSIVVGNRIGGSIMMAAELAKRSPALAAMFFARNLKPVHRDLGLGVLKLSPKMEAIRDKLLEDGYFFDRWETSVLRTMANLPTDEDATKSKNLLRARRLTQYALSFMAKAEMANAIRCYETLVADGMSEAEAVEEVERITRLTQNPSTALEETGAYTALKKMGLGGLFPFFGQPAVSANVLLKDLIKAKGATKAGRPAGRMWGNVGIGLTGLVASAVVTSVARSLVSSASSGLLTGGGDDDDKEIKKKLVDSASDLAAQLTDIGLPGAGKLVGALVDIARRPATMGNIGTALSENMAGRTIDTTARAVHDWYQAASEGDRWRFEKAVMDTIDAVSMWTGAPTGGLTQAARVASGLGGHRLGKKPSANTSQETAAAGTSVRRIGTRRIGRKIGSKIGSGVRNK